MSEFEYVEGNGDGFDDRDVIVIRTAHHETTRGSVVGNTSPNHADTRYNKASGGIQEASPTALARFGNQMEEEIKEEIEFKEDGNPKNAGRQRNR